MWFIRLAALLSLLGFTVWPAFAQTQIQPGRDIHWPATCLANMLYVPASNICTANLTINSLTTNIDPFIPGYNGRTANNPWTITRGTRIAPVLSNIPNIFSQIVGSIAAPSGNLPAAIVGQAISTGTGNSSNAIGVTGEGFTETAPTPGNAVGAIGIFGAGALEVNNGYVWAGWFSVADNGFTPAGVAGIEIDLNASSPNRVLGNEAALGLFDVAASRQDQDVGEVIESFGKGVIYKGAMVVAEDFTGATYSGGGALNGTSFANSIGQGSGLKHVRAVVTCSTAAVSGATCVEVLSYGNPFADTSYTVTCSGSGTTSGVPVIGTLTKLPGSVAVTTVAITAVAAQFTELDCIAMHD